MSDFKEYLTRQTYKRKNLFRGMSKGIYYRRLKDPNTLTIYELRYLMRVAELDAERVLEFIERGK